MINIVESIEKIASADSNRIAVKCSGESLSYYEVSNISDILGNYILKKFPSKIPTVIFGNKDVYIIPSMIASLKSGRAYVPIDISSPYQRIVDIIEVVEPEVIFDLSNDESIIKDIVRTNNLKCEIVTKNNIINDFICSDDNQMRMSVDSKYWVKGDENSYILFTSGTTGKPKGVQISTLNLDSFVNWIAPVLTIDGREVVVMDQPSYSFDLSVTSLYTALAFGSTLFSIPSDISMNFKELYKLLSNSDIEVWVSTPSYINMCLQDEVFNQELLPKLKVMIFIGEVLPVEVARKIKERFKNVKIVNGYGPTEATVGISEIEIIKEHIEKNQPLPVGIPMPNCKIKIMDENMNELPNGETGEIIIIGPSVSKGYYKNEEITKKSFYVDDSIQSERLEDKRAYKTGDLGKIGEDGSIYFFGRKDFQIKLNGYRIEIEDIENNLMKIDKVQFAAVLPVKNNDEISHLKAFVVLKSDEKSALKNTIYIKKELGKLVPKYMVPKYFEFIEEMPLNTNGKIDRKKLQTILGGE